MLVVGAPGKIFLCRSHNSPAVAVFLRVLPLTNVALPPPGGHVHAEALVHVTLPLARKPAKSDGCTTQSQDSSGIELVFHTSTVVFFVQFSSTAVVVLVSKRVR